MFAPDGMAPKGDAAAGDGVATPVVDTDPLVAAPIVVADVVVVVDAEREGAWLPAMGNVEGIGRSPLAAAVINP